MAIKKHIWFIESEEGIGKIFSSSTVDAIIKSLKRNACDDVVRMSQDQFLGTYLDELNSKLVIVPKVHLLPQTVQNNIIPISSPSRPPSGRQILSRPTSAMILHKPNPPHDSEKIVIIIDIQCSDSIEAINHVLRRRSSVSTMCLKIIALSSVLSWGGRRYPKTIADGDAEFRNRVPMTCAANEYSNENTLARLNESVFLKNGSNGVIILGIGLIYGEDGIDLKDALKALWYGMDENGPLSLPKLRDSCLVRLPLCHLSLLCSTTSRLAAKALHGESFSFHFLAVSDPPPVDLPSAEPFSELLLKMNVRLNGDIAAAQLADIPNSPIDQAATLPATVRGYLWNCDIAFGPHPSIISDSGGLLSGLDELWGDFLRGNNLTPVRILIAGMPKSGKSECSKLVAERLQLSVVDVISAVRFAFSFDSAALPAVRAENVDKDGLSAVKADILQLLDAKTAAENSKQKKDKNAPVEKVDRTYELSDLTESFCLSVPVEIVHKCIAAQIFADPVCARRGYVLDIWHTDLLNDGRKAAVQIAQSLIRTENTTSDNHSVSNEAIRKIIDVVVEIQAPSKAILDRLTQSFGPKPSKEDQAVSKALETRLSEYSTRMDTEKDSHKAVIDLEQALSSSTLQIDSLKIVKIGQVAAQSIADAVCEHALALRGGSLGWLDPATSAFTTDESTALPPTAATPALKSVRLAEVSADESLPAHTNPIDALSDKEKKKLAARAERLQAFLTATVLPHVSSGLVQCMRERPRDPIRYLSEHLLQLSSMQRQSSEDAARKNFYDLMRALSPPNTAASEMSSNMATSRTNVEE